MPAVLQQKKGIGIASSSRKLKVSVPFSDNSQQIKGIGTVLADLCQLKVSVPFSDNSRQNKRYRYRFLTIRGKLKVSVPFSDNSRQIKGIGTVLADLCH